MSPEQNKTAEKMKSVKAAWDNAPSGPKKDAALTRKIHEEAVRVA